MLIFLKHWNLQHTHLLHIIHICLWIHTSYLLNIKIQQKQQKLSSIKRHLSICVDFSVLTGDASVSLRHFQMHKNDQPQKWLQTLNKISVEKLKGAMCMFVAKRCYCNHIQQQCRVEKLTHPATTSATRTVLLNYREYLTYLSVPTFSRIKVVNLEKMNKFSIGLHILTHLHHSKASTIQIFVFLFLFPSTVFGNYNNGF